MNRQDWVKEVIAEEIVAAINLVKEEKPFCYLQIASDSADDALKRLDSQGVVLKVDGELPKLDCERLSTSNIICCGKTQQDMLEAGYTHRFERLI